MESRQSLVTPIDWKRSQPGRRIRLYPLGLQSLVTPIDWKHHDERPTNNPVLGRQSLVTPIDWKLKMLGALEGGTVRVANP